LKKKTIFFADRPEFRHIAQAVVGSFFDLKFCSSMEEAEASLQSPESARAVDLIACEVDFDDGRMHELLRFVRSNERTRPIPFICVKLREGRLTSRMLNSIRTSSELLGAQGFLHLADIISRHGEHAAFGMFRNTLRDLLEGSQRRSNTA
jgi:hypothetical protein